VSDEQNTRATPPFNRYDYYSRICGLASNALKTGTVMPSAFPLQALMAANQPPKALASKMSGLDLQETEAPAAIDTSKIEEMLQHLAPPVQLSTTDRFSDECKSSDFASVVAQLAKKTPCSNL